MALTEIQIVDLALSLCGIKRTSGRSANTAEIAQFNATYPVSREGMLALPIDWKFATARAELSELSEPAFGDWDYQYALPTKLVRIIAHVDEDDDREEYEYDREVFVDTDDGDKEKPVLLSNESSAFIKYIRNVNLSLWPAWFGRIVGLDLAILMCEPLKQDKSKIGQLIEMMNHPVWGWLTKAYAANGMENVRTNDEGVDLRDGNTEVLDASRRSLIKRYRYIKT